MGLAVFSSLVGIHLTPMGVRLHYRASGFFHAYQPGLTQRTDLHKILSEGRPREGRKLRMAMRGGICPRDWETGAVVVTRADHGQEKEHS